MTSRTLARCAARLVADLLVSSRGCGASGLVILRTDSAYCNRDVMAAVRRQGVAARNDRAVTAAVASIPEDPWSTIRYPNSVFDEQSHKWISDAEVAEVMPAPNITSERTDNYGHSN
jgi:hypothetical protein